MNYKESIDHNINCWKKEAENLRKHISFLKGKVETLEGVIESFEIIQKEQLKQ